MYDLVALGEILIDFTPMGYSPQGNMCFERNPGGAPANVAVCISKLGGETAFIGKVGQDMFGEYLKQVLEQHNINTSGLRISKDANTTLAFVQLDSSGDRSFSFYRNNCADITLVPEEIDYSIISKAKVFHFGSLSLTHEPARSATFAALKYAKQSGCMISYDPNLRPLLWNSLNEAKLHIRSVLEAVDILKVSEEELVFITGNDSIIDSTLGLHKDFGIKVIMVTRGERGCWFRVGNQIGEQEAFGDIKVVDTTGAGDAFLGGFLYSLIKEENLLNKLEIKDFNKHIRFGNAVAAISITGRGAIPAMPSLERVNKMLQQK